MTALASTDFAKNTLGDLDQNPIQILLNCFIDIDRLLKEGRLPEEEADLFAVRNRFKAHDLEMFSREFGYHSPFVNIYFTCCAPFLSIPAQTVNSKLSQS